MNERTERKHNAPKLGITKTNRQTRETIVDKHNKEN